MNRDTNFNLNQEDVDVIIPLIENDHIKSIEAFNNHVLLKIYSDKLKRLSRFDFVLAKEDYCDAFYNIKGYLELYNLEALKAFVDVNKRHLDENLRKNIIDYGQKIFNPQSDAEINKTSIKEVNNLRLSFFHKHGQKFSSDKIKEVVAWSEQFYSRKNDKNLPDEFKELFFTLYPPSKRKKIDNFDSLEIVESEGAIKIESLAKEMGKDYSKYFLFTQFINKIVNYPNKDIVSLAKNPEELGEEWDILNKVKFASNLVAWLDNITKTKNNPIDGMQFSDESFIKLKKHAIFIREALENLSRIIQGKPANGMANSKEKRRVVMITISNVLKNLGFDNDFQIGFCKLLLLCGKNTPNCFVNAMQNITESKSDKWTDIIQESGIQFPKTWLADTSELWQNDTLINDVLSFKFNINSKTLFNVLVACTQLQFFTERFKDFTTGTTNMYENDNKTQFSFAIRRLLGDLGFAKEHSYQQQHGPISNVFLHAATKASLEPRFDVLKDMLEKQPNNKITVYYSTNPRGLGRREGPTANILASWFTNDTAIQNEIAKKIQAIFDNSSIKGDWFAGLDNLRCAILTSVNEILVEKITDFPMAPEGEYPPIYDKTAKLDGNRDPMCSRWPHVGHLLNYLAKEHNIPSGQVEFVVMPVPGRMVGKKYCPMTTEGLVQAFFAQYPMNEITTNDQLVCISDNSVSNGALRQDTMLKLLLPKACKDKISVITYHDQHSCECGELARMFKEVAAHLHTFYTLDPDLNSKLDVEETASLTGGPYSTLDK